MKIIRNIRNTFIRATETISMKSHRKDFVRFFKDYLLTYNKKDWRVMKQAFTKYMAFLETLPENKRNRNPDRDIVCRFAESLVSESRGCGAASTYTRFKKVVIHAVEEGILSHNPCIGVRCPSNGDNLVKDILSEEEIRKMINTHYKNENMEIKRAFLFCLYTGIRFCDVISLKFSNFDLPNHILSFEQSKTKGRSGRSIVHIPIREDIAELIHKDSSTGADSKVFRLPSHPTCLKELRKWTTAAGIRKHITWHCARHSFATNILKNGADIKVVADLLGHSGLKYVEKYTRAMDKMKVKAVNSLPPISKPFVPGAGI